jgi:hypothetical protein
MSSIASLTSQIKDLLKVPNVKSAKVPKQLITQARNRPGLSVTELESRMLSAMADEGRKIGTFDDGTRDMMADFGRILLKVIVEGFQQDAKITVAIDPGLKLQATGGNAGGPVQSQGQTTDYGIGGGIIQ